MSDAVTLTAALATPIVAGLVAVWINQTRIDHDRSVTRHTAVRGLLDEGGRLLTTLFEQPPVAPMQVKHTLNTASLPAISVFRSRLLLWFEAEHDVVKRWKRLAELAEVITRMDRKSTSWQEPGEMARFALLVTMTTDQRRKYLMRSCDSWFVAAREHLGEILPGESWTGEVRQHFGDAQPDLR